MKHLPWALLLFGCGDAATPTGSSDNLLSPACVTRGVTWEICDGDRVWVCPDGPEEIASANLAVDAACQLEEDPLDCMLNARYAFVNMTLGEDCRAVGEVCVETFSAEGSAVSCELAP